MDARTDILEGGLADPVLQSQHAFKAVMDALSRPGLVRRLLPSATPPAPLTAMGGTIALTLCDQDTAVWLDRKLGAGGGVAQWLAFHTGATTTHDPMEADFAFLDGPENLNGLDRFAQGTQAFPDRSTTLVVPVDGFSGGRQLQLAGPGVNGSVAIAPSGLPGDFPLLWAANNALFPRGVDLVLAGPDGILGLPRTTRISRQGG